MWLEMSRDEKHGGQGWGFAECLWSPTHKNPIGKWPYWELLQQVERSDVVIHLRGKGKRAQFVGYSIADAKGYETTARPPSAGQWSYASSYYRVPLAQFVPFAVPVGLYELLAEREKELRVYFAENKQRSKAQRERLFYVVQSDRLQCLNGAYLSELGSTLGSIIFGSQFSGVGTRPRPVAVSAKTGVQLAQIAVRLGQDAFSNQVRENYNSRCCFPECSIAERSFLVGAHIARWADAEGLRGHTSNGLCLCLLHDRAFEQGIFTLTHDRRVAVNPSKVTNSPWSLQHIVPYAGNAIRSGAIPPAIESISKHWERIKFAPKEN